MSFDQPTCLASVQSNTRMWVIAWDGAVRASNVLDWQLTLIQAIDKVKKDVRKQVVEANLDGYRILFNGGTGKPSVLESAVNNDRVVQYMLVLQGDLLESIPSLSKAILKDAEPYRHLLPLLAHAKQAEDSIALLASTVLTALLSSAQDASPATVQRVLPSLLSYLSSLALVNSNAGLQDIGVKEFSSLLYSRETRQQFWAQRSETVAPLIAILRTAVGVSGASGEAVSASLWSGTTSNGNGNGNGVGNGQSHRNGASSALGRGGPLLDGAIGSGVGLQLLYHVLLVLWQLSFDAAVVGDDLNDEYDIVLLYTQLLRVSPKEKTTRLLVSTLLSLLSENRASLLPTAMLARLPAQLQNVAGRQHTDTDLQEDLQQLRELLDEYAATKTTFDEYVAEVNTGHLRWSPPHRSTVFWAENARRIFDADNGAIPRKLAAIMAKPWDGDKAVLAIACNDIGALVREVPERRSTLEKLGLKTRIMELMGEADETVRWESLKALGGWLKYSFETK